ncbi:uncharacterized protein LOC112155953 [Oryzias melastigma]|uniref:uncharacterized protein LOC112155953 n=1 Tax=Oryzias melastigma TaxID=30732 RepID=UPI000CF7ED45|nr:uncharacterized protein LOC112155953 [Oryzias melastigma]
MSGTTVKSFFTGLSLERRRSALSRRRTTRSRMLGLLLLLPLVSGVTPDYFMGTVMTYHPVRTDADGSVTVLLRYKMNLRSCGDVRWRCVDGDCGAEHVEVNPVSVLSGEECCQTEAVSTRMLPSSAPFQLQLDAGEWISQTKNGVRAARALTLVELRTRSDTLRPNVSPQTTSLPAVRVPSNCHRDLKLVAFDPDGDEVRCRYAAAPECLDCTPPSVLSLSSSCTLSFRPTGAGAEGPYVVQLMMEDFPRQNVTLTHTDGSREVKTSKHAISKVPVQFVLWVDPAAPECTEGIYVPQYLPPTLPDGAELYIPANKEVEITVTAHSQTSTISELLFSGPHGATSIGQDVMGPGVFVLKWTPSERETGTSHPFCYAVRALYKGDGFESRQQCVIVNVVPPAEHHIAPRAVQQISAPYQIFGVKVRVSTSGALTMADLESARQQALNLLISVGYLPSDSSVDLVSSSPSIK